MQWYRKVHQEYYLSTNIKANLLKKINLPTVIAIKYSNWHNLSLTLKVVLEKLFIEKNKVPSPDIDFKARRFLFQLIFNKDYLSSIINK